MSTAFHAISSTIFNNVPPDPVRAITRSSHPRHGPTPHVVFIVLLLVAMPVGFIYFLILHLFAWLAAPFAFSMLALFFLCITVSPCPQHCQWSLTEL
jgi:hypothetical protein